MPCTPCSINRRRRSSSSSPPRSQALGADLGRRFVLIAESDLNDPRIVHPPSQRRVRARRPLERGFPPRAPRGAHGRARRLLRRLRRDRGRGHRPPSRLRLWRALFGLPAPPARARGQRARRAALRGLPPEPRSGRQPRARRPPEPAREPGAGEDRRRARAHEPIRADDLPRRGVGGQHAVPVLHGPRGRWRSRAR